MVQQQSEAEAERAREAEREAQAQAEAEAQEAQVSALTNPCTDRFSSAIIKPVFLVKRYTS